MILLDTHAWLWWLSDPASLSPAARAAIEEARVHQAVRVSAMSVWEMAMLVKKGRLKLRISPNELVKLCMTMPFLDFVPVAPATALRSVELDPLHSDPADRMIMATALQLEAQLITKDQRMSASGQVPTIW